ncbi:MAG TPA: hypothetical protein VKC15_15885 [Gemmatimonadales bacterium]|nr:hypothetical protein [Gemmatimonadales bacterium]
MKRHWSARLFGASLALWFGLTMVGLQAHQCPVHDNPTAPAAAHRSGHASHDAPASHQHCSCPQACCPAGVGVALPVASSRWTTAATPIADAAPTIYRVVLPRAPRHLLPLALAPPYALA